MNIIIPVGGLGKEFSECGYLSPQPLVKFLGRPMIFWVLDQFKCNVDLNMDMGKSTIYIIYHHYLKRYNFKEIIVDNFKDLDLKFIELFYQTSGVIETILLALKSIDNINRPLISFDCDTFYRNDILKVCKHIIHGGGSGGGRDNNCVFYFEDYQDQPFYSYIAIDPNTSMITHVAEKNKISNYANTGCYCFLDGLKFYNYCELVLNRKMPLYVSSVINLMIEHGESFLAHQLGIDEFVCLGNPHLLKINSQQQGVAGDLTTHKRFCFDLDYTLVKMIGDNKSDYTQVVPIWRNINFLNFLKDQGHTIIIQTARRMKTHGGNTGKLMKDIGQITFETLDKFNIRYDEIYFGKPWADFYIDDLAINSYYDLEKELGYYSLFIPERSHNNLTVLEHSIIKRNNNIMQKENGQTESNVPNLDGEIFWYKNIPKKISDLFPNLLNCGENNSSYEIEKIEGVTLSHFYLNENLTPSLLLNMLTQIERIHNSLSPPILTKSMSDSIIYANYLQKLEQRYRTYDYSKFNDSNEVYQKLKEYFTKYKEEKRGSISVIHGDPVFTNILLTKYMNFKFIDMRGKSENILTLFGDKWYDYAKIYQSLYGYDEILLQQTVNRGYKEHLLKCFNDYILDKFGLQTLLDIKWIAASLLFTLIPLHNNDKCQNYYQLITI